jgi:hypothetical protein
MMLFAGAACCDVENGSSGGDGKDGIGYIKTPRSPSFFLVTPPLLAFLNYRKLSANLMMARK